MGVIFDQKPRRPIIQFQYLDQPLVGFSSILQKIMNLTNVVFVQTLIFINELLDM